MNITKQTALVPQTSAP